MESLDTNMIVSVLAIILGSAPLSALIIHFLNRKKTNAESRSVEVKGELEIVNSAIILNQEFRKELTLLKDELNNLKNKYDDLEKENQNLNKKYIELLEENADLRNKIESFEKKQ